MVLYGFTGYSAQRSAPDHREKNTLRRLRRLKGWQRDLLLLLGLGGWCLSLPYRTTVGYKKSHSGSWLMRTPDISTDVLIERRNLWEGHGLAMQRCRHLPSPSLSSPTDLQLCSCRCTVAGPAGIHTEFFCRHFRTEISPGNSRPRWRYY